MFCEKLVDLHSAFTLVFTLLSFSFDFCLPLLFSASARVLFGICPAVLAPPSRGAGC